MAAAPNTTLVSVEEYLTSSYEPECEYVDGALEPKAATGYKHGRLQYALMKVLESQQEKLGYDFTQQFRIRIGPHRFRIPDISVLPSRPTTDDYANVAPLLTIEILSKGDRWHNLMERVRDQREMGVPTAIIVDPRLRAVFIVGQDGLLRQVAEPLHVSVEIQDRGTLDIDFDELFRQLD